MKKLKSKVFLTLFTILTIFLMTILIIFNYQDYRREKTNIINNLSRMTNSSEFDRNHKKNDKELDFDKNKRFIDAKIYTILLNENNEIKEVISHTEDGKINENVESIVLNIIKNNKDSKTYIGNLYNGKYSYKYSKNNVVILIDNMDTNNRLSSTLKISLIIFIFLEVVIYFIASYLSKWITRPALDSFNKQKEFIADASHELKTPLSVIIASTEAYEKDNDKKWLNNIKSESNRMNNLIKNLLDLAKLESGNVEKQFELVNLSKLTEKSVLTLESLIYEKNIKLDYNIDKEIMFNCNIDEIKELITILLDNAIKHSIDNGEIIINLSKSNKICLSIKNKGLPIPKGEEEKIFERFYRTDKSRNRNENRYGLGLAIAKEIVLRHGGVIKASSSDNYTTFEVVFK